MKLHTTPALGDRIAQALTEENAVLAGRISDRLRLEGLDYKGTLSFVEDCMSKRGLWRESIADEWESLMYRADTEGNGDSR